MGYRAFRVWGLESRVSGAAPNSSPAPIKSRVDEEFKVFMKGFGCGVLRCVF